MTEKEHPVRKIYMELGLNRREFAAMCGLAYQSIYLFERGYYKGVHSKVLSTLETLGYEPSLLKRSHADFLARMGEEVWEKVLAKV